MTLMPTKPASAQALVTAFEDHRRAEQCGVEAHIRDASQRSLLVTYRDTIVSRLGMEWLDEVAEKFGWYRTRSQNAQTKSLVFFEPKISAAVASPKELYHATSTSNANRILQFGFDRATVGRTWMNRTYFTARVFFATSLEDAVGFIRSMKEKAASTEGTTLTQDDLEAWDVLKVDPGDRSYYPDAEFLTAVWTDENVPAEDVSKLNCWRNGLTS